MENYVLTIKDLTKTYKIYNKHSDRLKEAFSMSKGKKVFYKEFNALKNVSFEVNQGDAIGILGRNGSGKSTLLKIITGVLTATSGDIKTNGKISSILELGAGFNQEYTGIENIYLNGTILGYTKAEIAGKIDSIIEFADIGDFINQPVKIYSSGMFARLAFAVAINIDPDILIIDEVLAVGDTRFQIKCIEKMKSLKESGITILFVSHATEQIKRFCNKAIWLKDGEVILDGESSKVVDIYDDFMRNGDQVLESLINIEKNSSNKKTNDVIIKQPIQPIEPIEKKEQIEQPKVNEESVMASITNVEINETEIETFDQLIVDVKYEVFEEKIDGLLLGVAIYTAGREYIFGPNTHLENVKIKNTIGSHNVKYKIPSMTLLKGTFLVDVGIFNNEGLVMIDYKTGIKSFTISNKYISEGQLYIKHEWEVIK